MTSPNSKPHRPKQMPPFWDELTGTEREIWQTLTDEERRTLSEFYEADPNIYPIKIALANKRTSAEPEALGAAEPTPSSPTPPTRREETDEERKRKADLARRAERWNRETPTQRTERLEREQRPNRRRERAAASAPPARRAEARQTAQALESAEESAGILSALARLCWPEAHDGEECPQEHIPTMDDLCPFLFDVPDQAQAALALAALLEDITQDANFHDLDPDQFRWEWTTFALTPIERPPQGLSKWKTFVDSIKTDLAAMLRYQEEGETLRVAIPGRNRPEVPVFIPLETVHQVWKATPPPRPPTTPAFTDCRRLARQAHTHRPRPRSQADSQWDAHQAHQPRDSPSARAGCGGRARPCAVPNRFIHACTRRRAEPGQDALRRARRYAYPTRPRTTGRRALAGRAFEHPHAIPRWTTALDRLHTPRDLRALGRLRCSKLGSPQSRTARPRARTHDQHHGSGWRRLV